MSKIRYQKKRFGADSLALIRKANEIIEDYQGQGFVLTLRQLYYQFVSRDLLPNTVQSYKRLGSVINDARLAGEIDWEAIEDRTRNLHSLASWDDPADIVAGAARQFKTDLWATQPCRVEVWVEKEALAGVFEGVCDKLRVPMFCCRGYTSQSEMWVASQRLLGWLEKDQEVHILHFGDHDPSGIDMSRDIQDRIRMFGVSQLQFERLALNMDQVEAYSPPPNPAKSTDSRFAGYIKEYGEESWELDALEPSALAELVQDQVEGLRDPDKWEDAELKEFELRETLVKASKNWDRVAKFVSKL